MSTKTVVGAEHPNHLPVLASEGSDGRAHEPSAEHGLEPRPSPLRTPAKHGEWVGFARMFVLSSDHALIDVVHRAAGGHVPVVPVAHWPELITAVQAKRCDIVLLDVDHLGLKIAKRLVELEQHAARVVTLVAANRSDSQALIGFLGDHKVHRLLIKPTALGHARLILESAVARSVQLREAARSSELAPPEVLPSAAQRVLAPAREYWVRRVRSFELATALVLVAALIALTQLLTPRAPDGDAALSVSEPSALTAPATPSRAVTRPMVAARGPVPQSNDASDRFAKPMAQARQAVADGRLAEPPGDNALDYYLTILNADPKNVAAGEEMRGILERLFTDAETALLDDSLDNAATTLGHVRRAAPDSARLAFLGAQLEASRRVRAADLAAAVDAQDAAAAAADGALAAGGIGAGLAASQSLNELESLLTIANARIERGQWLNPTGDSARDYVARAAALNASDERVRALRSRVAGVAVESARSVLDAGDIEQSARLARTARDFGADSASLRAVEAAVAAARAELEAQGRAELLTTGRERLMHGAFIEPANDSAYHYLSTLKDSSPDYPGLEEPWRALMEILGVNAQAAIADGNWSGAERWIDALARAEPEAAGVPALRGDLEAARLQEQFLASLAPSRDLALLDYTLPEYPQVAMRNGIEGWVDLEFVVGTDGVPREITAVASEPPGRFEEAALDAVATYRYEPFEFEGRLYQRRLALRIRFTLE